MDTNNSEDTQRRCRIKQQLKLFIEDTHKLNDIKDGTLIISMMNLKIN